ncbi:MAG: competence type IV pilus major pilin ComGC [Armatimonadota bacterium]
MTRFISRRRRGGFTLVEIMIVVLIISVLLSIAIPNFMRARETSRAKSCCSNLRQIETAKEQWAMDNKASDGDEVTGGINTLVAQGYLKQTPKCPSGGTYTINPIGTNATCSFAVGKAPGDYNYHGLEQP